MGYDMFTGFGDYGYEVISAPARVSYGDWWNVGRKRGKSNASGKAGKGYEKNTRRWKFSK